MVLNMLDHNAFRRRRLAMTKAPASERETFARGDGLVTATRCDFGCGDGRFSPDASSAIFPPFAGCYWRWKPSSS